MIAVLTYGAMILLGVAIGTYCQPVFMTIICFLWFLTAALMYRGTEGLASIVPFVVGICGLICTVAMWITYLLTGNSAWIGAVVHTLILR